MRRVRWLVATALVVGVAFGLASTRPAAAAAEGEFYIQVYPSPLVTTVKPGTSTSLDLTIRNSGAEAEDLKIVPRAFKIDPKTQQLQLSDNQLPDIASWVSFSDPIFAVQPGQAMVEHIQLSVPKDTGFSYAFALVISRAHAPVQTNSGRNIKASVAVFLLINVDRPGATRSLEVTRFEAKKSVYEYLPVEFDIDFKNTGNTIVQPGGTIYIQRGPNDTTPVDTLQVNQAGSYVLPGLTRTLTAKWDKGFQVLQTTAQPDGSSKEELKWDWAQFSNLRIGRYTAKLIAIYDDGHRDVDLQNDTTFWVIPWRMLLIVVGVVVLMAVGVWSLTRGAFRASRTLGRKKMRL